MLSIIFCLIIKNVFMITINVNAPTGTITDNNIIQIAICNSKNLTFNVNCGFKQSNPSLIPNKEIEGVVILQSGTYIIHQLYLYSNIVFKGQGKTLTTLKLQNSAKSYYLTPDSFNNGQSGLIRALGEENIEIRDMTLDGNKQNQIDYLLYRYDDSYIDPNDYSKGKKYMRMPYNYGRFGIYTEVCNNVIIDNVIGKNFMGYGIADPHGEGDSEYQDYTKYGSGLIVSNCESFDNDWDGLTIDKTRFGKIFNNKIYNNGRHGINIVTGSYDIEVYDNELTNNGHYFLGTQKKGCGIMGQNNQLYDVYDLNIHHNQISNSNYGGVCLNSVTNSIISNNNIFNQDTYCIRFGVQNTNYEMLFQNIFPSYTRGNPTTTNYNNINNNNCNNNKNGIVISHGKNNIFELNNINTYYSTFGIKNNNEKTNESTNTFIGNTFSGNILLDVLYSDINSMSYMMHPYPNNTPDPTCANGILNKNVCCESSCGTCGGIGCTGLCCTASLITTEYYCDEYSAPCIIPEKIYPINGSDPTCANGILSSNKKHCCESSCGICGGTGCGTRDGLCCTSQIDPSWKCTNFNAPCIL